MLRTERFAVQALVCLVLLVVPWIADAQEATISGVITDATGGVLPGTTITALHAATGNSFVAVTDDMTKAALIRRIRQSE